MPNQFYGITGIRRRPGYVEDINARRPYLRDLYRRRKADVFNEKLYRQQQEELELGREQLAEDISSSRKDLELREEQAQRSGTIGALGLGANIWLGSKRNRELKRLIEEGTGKGNITGGVSKTVGLAGPDAAKTTPKTFLPEKWYSPKKITDTGSWTKSLTTPSTWLTGIGGGFVGAEGGEAIGKSLGIGGKKEQRVVGGAIGGAAADYLLGSGGDPYSMILSGLIGGGTGWLSGGLF